MICVEHVTKTYGGFTAVDDVSFTARPGRVTGFLGPNGAGKSTTLRVVVGLTPPDHGTGHVRGRRFRDVVDSGQGAAVDPGDMVHGNHRDPTAAALEAWIAVVGALKPFTIR
jgi:ABC-type uncharacterized transport system ATPase subunit